MKERDIFTAALEITDPIERTAYLDKACAGNAVMQRRIELLLATHGGAGDFLERPAAEPMQADGGRVSDATAALDMASRPEPASPRTEAGEDEEDAPLTFLTPSSKADSLGRLAHYEVLEILGCGGFGIVLRAFDEMLHRVVAVKVMAPQLAATSPARKRFLREARASAAVRHDNVVAIHNVAERPIPYLVMEFIAGETVQQRLDHVGPLEAAEVARIGRQIAEGLAEAHTMGLIHRDIKPSNILLESGADRAKITDFGLARAADDASLTQSGVIAGTPMYMAPEQAKGEVIDHRADLFSLGSVLYAMCSGRPPFRASTTLAVLKRVAEDAPRPIREIIPEVPEWLCAVIARLHAKQPDERFQSAREVADVLADCEAQLAAHACLRDLSRIPVGKSRRSGRWRWAAAAAVVLACLALGLTEATGLTRLFRGRQLPTDPLEAKRGPALLPPAQAEGPLAGRKPAGAAVPQPPPLEEPPGEQRIKQLAIYRKRIDDAWPEKKLGDLLNLTETGGFSIVLDSSGISNLQPFEGIPFTHMNCTACPVEDLRPLKGMPLVVLHLYACPRVRDLTPLKGMKLTELNLHQVQATDLTPLKGMPLKKLSLWQSAAIDLRPLQGMPLTYLLIRETGVTDLAPLNGMPLNFFDAIDTNVTDIAPLKDMPLTTLHLGNTKVKELTPLDGMKLVEITLPPGEPQGLELLRKMKSIEKINDMPAAEFWKQYDDRKN